MVEKYIKFISKSIHKNRLEQVVEDIIAWNDSWYDKKKLRWKKSLWRIRVWSIRVIYEITDWTYIIHSVINRGDWY
jgi:mRNA-degrading endonuclease RelE of RelBE toxin-antitoxin system